MSSLAPMALRRNAARKITPAPGFARYQMAGHSGAKIFLTIQGERRFVRKIAGKPLQNSRLMAQSAKLRALARDGIAVPYVFCDGKTETGLAYYDMEYVPSRSLAAAICDGRSLSIPTVLHTLERIFAFFQLTQGDSLPAAAFHEKIDKIESIANTGPCHTHQTAIRTMANRLRTQSWEGIPASKSHGDLTLENILVTASDRVVFIDCDNGWLSSWWIDAAKLYQDIAGHWFLRMLYLKDETGQTLLRANQRIRPLRQALDASLMRLDPALPPRLNQLSCLHLFRTVPYARDASLVAFVLARMAALLPPTNAASTNRQEILPS